VARRQPACLCWAASDGLLASNDSGAMSRNATYTLAPIDTSCSSMLPASATGAGSFANLALASAVSKVLGVRTGCCLVCTTCVSAARSWIAWLSLPGGLGARGPAEAEL